MVRGRRSNVRSRAVGVRKATGMQHAFRGHEVKVPPQPPEFTSRPWWPLVVRIDDPGTLVGVGSIIGSLRTQLGFAATVPIQIKLQTLRVWGPLVGFDSTGPLGPLNVAFMDFIQEASAGSGLPVIVNRTLEQYTRYPDQVNRACVGFSYSLAHQSISLASAVGNDVDIMRLTGVGPGAVAYVKLLWRSGVNNPFVPPVGYESEDSEVEVISVRSRSRK